MPPPVLLPVEDFPLNGPGHRELVQKLKSSPLIQIPRKPLYPHGCCYWSVAKHCETHGGVSVQGWQVTWVPGLYIEATHHAVWKAPDGSLVDLSSPSMETTDGQDSTTFSISSPIKIDYNWPMLIENKHVALKDDQHIREALAQYRINNRANVRLCDEARKIKWMWSITQGWTHTEQVTPLMGLLNHQLAKSYRELHRIRAVLLSKYFSKQEAPTNAKAT